MKIAIIEGIFATVHITLTGGSFLTGYALLLGASKFQIGLLGAIPFLSQSFQILSAYWIEKSGKRKPLSVWGSIISREIWIPLIFIPYLVSFKSSSILIFLVLIAISNIAGMISTAAWLSWMSDLVPSNIRGRYFGFRNTILAVVTMTVSYGGAHILDYYKNINRETDGFALILSIAVICAAIAGFFLTKQYEPRITSRSSSNFKKLISVPFADTNYRKVLILLAYWSFATGISSPFFSVFMLEDLKMKFSQIALFSIISGTISLISYSIWGKILDRIGTKPAMYLQIMGIITLPFIWLFATPDNLLPIWIDAVGTGIFWPGMNLSVFNLQLATSPQKERSIYLAVQSTISGMTFFISATVGGIIAEALEGVFLSTFFITINNLQIIFFISSVLRMGTFFFLLRVREPSAKSLRKIVRTIITLAVSRFSVRPQLENLVLNFRLLKRKRKKIKISPHIKKETI